MRITDNRFPLIGDTHYCKFSLRAIAAKNGAMATVPSVMAHRIRNDDVKEDGPDMTALTLEMLNKRIGI